MGILKRLFEDSEEEKMAIQAAMTAEMLAEKQKKMMTCNVCKRIFSEGIPYQKTLFGKPKNYVCTTCAKNMGLIS